MAKLLNLLPWRRRRLEHDLDRELRYHNDRRVLELMESGLNKAEARRRAAIEFGGLNQVQEQVRETWNWRWLDHLVRHVRYAGRTLRRSPGFTAAAVLSLALGIGANAAIFSLFEQILIRPLPVQQPDRLVNLSGSVPNPGWKECTVAGGCEVLFSYPMFRDLERSRTGFAGIAAHRGFDANLAYSGETRHGAGMLVSGSYFPLLGIRPSLGRLLGPADDETIGAHAVAVLSHGYWEGQLGADPNVLNRTITINGRPMTIVGVAPRGFHGTSLGIQPQVFVPMTMGGAVLPRFAGSFDQRLHYWIYLFGRLNPGTSIQQAGTSINAVYGAIINEVEAPLQEGMSEQSLAQFREKKIALEPGARGQSTLHGETQTPLLLLFATTGIVLLIACANIANLLLARGANRNIEMVIRRSLGASRRRVIGQLLTESCVLAALGGIASLLLARWLLAGIAAIMPTEFMATLHIGLRWPVVLFTALLTLGTGLLFGMFPAFHGTRTDLATTIRAGAVRIAGARSAARFRTGLVTAQIALSMVLLVSAGLFSRSLRNISDLDLGLSNMEHVVTFTISPELNGYDPARSRIVFERVEEELAALPGVLESSGSVVPVLAGVSSGTAISVEAPRQGPPTEGEARINMVAPDYFRALGIALLAGREFTTGDAAGASRVAIVTEAFAEKFDLGRDAVGKRMGTGMSGDLDIEIVGLVRNAKFFDVKGEAPPLFVMPYRQDESAGALTFYARTMGDPQTVLRSVAAVIAALDPNLPVEGLKLLPQQLRETVVLDRIVSILSMAFAALATLLAVIGLYGVMAYTVAQRTREIGLRVALGADGRSIRGMILRQVGRMVLIGVVIGTAAALALGRAVESLLFGLQGNDPIVVSLAMIVLTLVAVGAGCLPAYRASRVSPVQALHHH